MKKTTAVFLAALISSAVSPILSASPQQKVPADGRGTLPQFMRNFYIGAEAGYGYPNYTNDMYLSGYTATSTKNGGIGAHPFMGYRFNRYIAAEMDVFYFSRPTIYGIPPGSSTMPHHNIFGFYATGFYPFKQDWLAFAKAGVGWAARSDIMVGSTTALPQGDFFTPLASVGLAYEFHKQWFVDVSANYMFANSAHQLPFSQFYGVGIYYELGDQYD